MLHICELLDQAHHQGMINGWICVGRPALKGLDVVIEPCGALDRLLRALTSKAKSELIVGSTPNT
jgi:hypothetical protein